VIQVAIADDMEMIRSGFQLIVDHEPDMAVVASVADGNAIVEVCGRRPVDVVLMDIRMPERDGLSAAEAILAQADAPRILILTTFGLDEYVSQAIGIGCSGFLLKDATADVLVSSIRSVHQGDSVMAPSLLGSVFEQLRADGPPSTAQDAQPEPVPGVADLTDRELDVLRLLAGGRSNAEIAAELFLSEATIKTHITRILSKLGVRDRVQAVIAAFAAGVAKPGQDDATPNP
jgi:DNA-binding NarL/FixJ family response regulator